MATSKTSAKKASPKKKAAPAAKKAAPAAKKARVVPKQSPLKGMSVEAWIQAKATGWQAKAIQKIVGLIRAAAPSASASIKWGQPVFDLNGPFAWMRPAKGHVSFGFWRGAELSDPKKLLEGTGSRMAHVKIASVEGIDAEALTSMIREAVRLNQERGNPTRGG